MPFGKKYKKAAEHRGTLSSSLLGLRYGSMREIMPNIVRQHPADQRGGNAANGDMAHD